MLDLSVECVYELHVIIGLLIRTFEKCHCANLHRIKSGNFK